MMNLKFRDGGDTHCMVGLIEIDQASRLTKQ